ncbi:hypothetical protein Cfor_03908, partial [Coptotermes formosanus]
SIPDHGRLRSLERVFLLELFLLAPKTGGLKKNCSSSGFSILANSSNYLTTILSFLYWTMMQVTFPSE